MSVTRKQAQSQTADQLTARHKMEETKSKDRHNTIKIKQQATSLFLSKTIAELVRVPITTQPNKVIQIKKHVMQIPTQ